MNPEVRLIHKITGNSQILAVSIKLEMQSVPQISVCVGYNKLVS